MLGQSKFIYVVYYNLTLENVILESESADYVLSNNYGKTNLTGKTSIYAGEGNYAFDAFYWPKNGYKEPPKITVNTTGVIEGKIQIKDDGTRAGENLNKSASVTIENGTISKPINVDDKLGCLTINGGKINEITAVDDAENRSFEGC